MTWHQKFIVNMMLAVARYVARISGETDIADELKTISNSVAVGAPSEMLTLTVTAADKVRTTLSLADEPAEVDA